MKKVEEAVRAALQYEMVTEGKRKLGITAEVGEVLVCSELRLRLVADPRSQGYDALDEKGARVQIKTRRSETRALPRAAGRLGTFSRHEFDYALLALLDHDYRLCEVWRASYEKLKPIIEKEKRRNPTRRSFKRLADKVFDSSGGKFRESVR